MKAIIVDFDTEIGREFEQARPIGVLLERDVLPGFDSLYLETVTNDEDDTGHDNYVRMMDAVADVRFAYDKGQPLEGMVSVEEMFTRLADDSYLGVRLRTLGKVEDGVSLEEAFTQYVTLEQPLVIRSDEEFPTDV